MKGLRVYATLSRFSGMTYGSKIVLIGGFGALLPIAVLCGLAYNDLRAEGARIDPALVGLFVLLLVSFAGTVAGLRFLVRPMEITAAAMRGYGESRAMPDLPTHFLDDVGVLMADTQMTITHLDGALQHLERFDPVTGVLNRTGLAAHLRGQPSEGYFLLVIRFCNGSVAKTDCEAGHYDQVHRVLVKRMALQFGTNLRARVGELDYIIVMPKTTEPREAGVFRLRASLDVMSAEVGFGVNRVCPELTAGVAPLEADVMASSDTALATARTASLSSPIAVQSAQEQDKLGSDFVLEKELRFAISNDELVLHFQPVMDTQQQRAIGAEALLRWNSPNRGLVPPVNSSLWQRRLV
jgi:predicted signal transduction protein with EAL and GGDEF domain